VKGEGREGKRGEGRAAVGMGIPMGTGDSHGCGYGMGMGTVMNPYGPVGILWGFLAGWRLSGNALNMR